MTFLLILLALLLLAALAPAYGTDTRDLRDDAFDRDNLWSRVPRA